jgi:hypothetical protein
MIGITAGGSKDHRNVLRTEIPARQNAGGIIVDPADCDVADKTGMIDRVFQPERASTDLRRHDTLRNQVPGERHCLVLSHILYIEALAVQIAGLDDVVVEQGYLPDALPHQGGRDLGIDPARADAQHAALREDLLIESGNLLLSILGAGDGFAAQLNSL